MFLLLLISGPMLVIDATPHHVDTIVVIGGDHKPSRIKKAAALYEQGYAPSVIISAGTSVLEGGEWMAEAEVMKRQAIAAGLPEMSIILETESLSTYENAYYSKKLSKKQGIESILLVTSAYHSRRAYHIFQEVMEPEISVLIQPAGVEFCSLCWIFYPDQVYVVFYEYYNWAKYWFTKLE